MRELARIPRWSCVVALSVIGCDETPSKGGTSAPSAAAASSAASSAVTASPSASSKGAKPGVSSNAAAKTIPAEGDPFDEWPLSREEGEAVALPPGDDCTSPKSSDAWQSSSAKSVPPRTVELVDAGQEPRAVLRYAFSAGTLVERTMMTDSGKRDEPDWRGGVERSLFSRVRCVDPSGAARVEVSLDDPSFTNTQWFVVSSQGSVQRMGYGAAPGEEMATPEATSAAMMFGPTPLPEEEVGPGAVWRVTVQAANDMTQIDEHRLISHEGSEVRTSLTISQKRTPKVAADQVPSSGKGAHRIDLKAPLDARWQWAGNPEVTLFGLMLRPKAPELPPLGGTEGDEISPEQQEQIRRFLDSAAKKEREAD